MKPFNLEEALAGEPVVLRNGMKAFIKFKLPKTSSNIPYIGYYINNNSNCVEIAWDAYGMCEPVTNRETLLDVIGMWEEPKRVINGIEVPEPVTMEDLETGAYYWHVHLYCSDFVAKSIFSRKSSGDIQLIKKVFVFKTKEDAKAMAKALLNYKVEYKED